MSHLPRQGAIKPDLKGPLMELLRTRQTYGKPDNKAYRGPDLRAHLSQHVGAIVSQKAFDSAIFQLMGEGLIEREKRKPGTHGGHAWWYWPK